jgi:hypothetical protein
MEGENIELMRFIFLNWSLKYSRILVIFLRTRCLRGHSASHRSSLVTLQKRRKITKTKDD